MARFASAFVLLLVVFTLFPLCTAVGVPDNITITAVLTRGPSVPGPPVTGTNTGTWSASGAFTDSGDAIQNYQMCFAGEDLRIVSEGIFTGADGDIIIQMVLLGYTFIPDPLSLKFEGVWAIVGGTGQYANSGLKGQGTVTVIVDLLGTTNFVTFEGSIKL